VDGDGGNHHESGNGEEGEQQKRVHPLLRIIKNVMTKKDDPEKKKNLTIEMLQPSRYKPNNLQQMAEDTKFTKSKTFDRSLC